MEPTELLPAVALLLLIGVEFGGWSLLWFITSKREVMDERRIQFFRAGHAHGGVLTILSLVYFVYLDRTGFPKAGSGAWHRVVVGALAQSGGSSSISAKVLPTAPRPERSSLVRVRWLSQQHSLHSPSACSKQRRGGASER